jgi:hypothetical protein
MRNTVVGIEHLDPFILRARELIDAECSSLMSSMHDLFSVVVHVQRVIKPRSAVSRKLRQASGSQPTAPAEERGVNVENRSIHCANLRVLPFYHSAVHETVYALYAYSPGRPHLPRSRQNTIRSL